MIKKIIVGLGVGLLLLVIGVAVLGYLAVSSLDTIIETGIETVGSEIAGVKITVDSVSMSPLSGIAEVKGFVIGNPKGYKSDYAMKLGRVKIAIDLASLSTDVPRIKDFVIDGTSLVWEGSFKGSNLSKIQRNVEAFIGESADNKDEKEQKIIIEHFLIKNSSVKLSLTALKGKGQEIALSDIEFNDIGTENNGATAREVVSKVMPVVFREVGKIAATIGVGTAVGGPIGGAVAVPVTEGVKKVGSTVKEVGGNIKSGIGKLFGR